MRMSENMYLAMHAEHYLLTSTGQLYNKPGWLLNLMGYTTATSNDTYTLYDGFGTSDEIISTFRAADLYTFGSLLILPIYVKKGVYVTLSTSVAQVAARIIPLSIVEKCYTSQTSPHQQTLPFQP